MKVEAFDEAKLEVENFIRFYNEEYPHSALRYLSSIDFEKLNNYKDIV